MNGATSTAPCERADLVEAMVDGRLGAGEVASVERHLRACAECTALRADLVHIRATLREAVPSIAPLDHQRARLALLRRAAAPTASRRRPIFAVVIATMLAPVAVWAAMNTLAPRHAATDVGHSTLELPPAESLHRQAPLSPVPVPVPVPVPDLATTTPPPASADAVVLAPRAEAALAPPGGPPAAGIAPSNAAAAARPSEPRVAPPAPPAPAGSASPASRSFNAGMDAVARGDFGAGAAMLEEFAARYPNDPRVEEAMYLDAIALERAGRIDEARTAARKYLAAYPAGAYRARAAKLVRE